MALERRALAAVSAFAVARAALADKKVTRGAHGCAGDRVGADGERSGRAGTGAPERLFPGSFTTCGKRAESCDKSERFDVTGHERISFGR